MKNKNEKGITLVSLVITIIILLILAGVGINMAISSDGLFAKAKEAAEKWNESVKQEEDILGKLTEEYLSIEANKPEVKEGMIPVYYDNGWKKADKTKDNWYSYDVINKKWANVVTVKETGGSKTRAEYEAAEVGTAIAEEDILAMFVWIPRYAYMITEGYHTAANGTGEIQIKFLNETKDEYTGGTALRQKDTNAKTNGNNYVVHPAFTTEVAGKEITGMWVGKFESSNASSPYNNEGITNSSSSNLKYGRGDGTTTDVTIKPNVTSWRAISVPDIFSVCLAMNDEGNIHGLTNETDTRMMVNTQWGAVAYLTQSKYGNRQTSENDSGVWNNSYTEGYIYENPDNSSGYGMENYSTTLTGMVGSTRNENTNYYSKVQENGKTDNGNSITIKYNNVNTVATDSNGDGTADGGPNGTLGSEFTRTYYRYNTSEGVKGSTTRNVYGIYDMAGGSWEYMASFLEAGTTSYVTTMLGKTEAEKAYMEMYEGTGATSSAEDRTANYEANKDKYGDALYETSNGATGANSWNGDYSHFPSLEHPLFIRGGHYSNDSNSGVFAFHYADGGTDYYCGFRAVAL